MSDVCEGSPAEDPSAISLNQPSSESLPIEPRPEGEPSSEVERGSSEPVHPQENEEEQSVTESSGINSEAASNTQSTPVKRYVIADSDDDVTDEEDGAQRSWNSEERILKGDHDYAAPCESKLANKVEPSEAFPVLPGLAELGIVSDDLEVPSEQHIASSRIPPTHLGYEQREPNIINRSPAAVRDGGVYRASESQSGYLARPARTTIQASSGYRGVQVAPDRSLPHTQQHQQPHFFVAGYNGAPVARRVMTTAPISSPSIVQKRTMPRIVTTPTQMRLSGPRVIGNAQHVSTQQPNQRQSPAVVAAPPVQRQVDPPPHRSFHQGPETSHRVVLVQSGAGSRVAFSPADPSQAALANAPAPLLVSSRGTRPIVRGRGGSVTGRVKKESTSGVSGEETSPTHSPQATPRIPLNTPLHGTRTVPISPRKQVHFSDGVAVGPGSGGAPSPLRMQGMPPTSLHPDADSSSHQGGIRSPSRLTSARIRAPAPTVAPHSATAAVTASVTSPTRTIHTTSPQTPPLPENFVDDAEAGSQSYTESEANKNSTLPPEVIAAATSLSAETGVNHPQWTNNDISAEDFKAKIEEISREIAQEMEEKQKKMESEAQAREKRRPSSDVATGMRRRSGADSQFSGGEEMETGGPATGAPRGRGRPRGSGRTRSSLSSSSSTGMGATNTTPLHHEMSEGPYGATRSTDYQSSRITGRSSIRGNVAPITAYDGSMAPELPPPLPPISNAQTLRGAYQSPGLAQSPHASQRTSTSIDQSPLSPGYQQKGVNGVSPDEDLANVSTDPSSDEEEATEEAEWGDYVTRCLCEMQHNDEWMVECEQCNVWQHMKCMGIDPKKFNQNDTYLCEYCKPRPLKWTKKQAQELQLKQLKAVSREKERKMAEKLRRREERKRAKLSQRLKERNLAKTPKRGPAAYKKFQLISRNEYTKRAKQMLALFDTTAGAQSILENSRDLKRGKRMFVAPDIEGLVSTEAIKQDDVIMEYVGHVCLPDECPGRLQRGALQPYCVLYNGLGQNLLCIDARRQGSEARFARRCCRSNSTLKHVLLNGSIYVMLVASERIEKGTEVTIPFDCDFRDTLVPVECACGEDPNCYMKQFNNSLRNKASFEERSNRDVTAQQSQPSNGTASSRAAKAAASPQKPKTENRGRPKGSGKKEKVADDTPRKKGPVGRKPKKVGIRLRRHSDSKNTKSSDESMEQSAETDTADNMEEKMTEEKEETTAKKEPQVAEAPSTPHAPPTESAAEEVKEEEKVNEPASTEQPESSSQAKQASEGNKSAPSSPKKEEQQPRGGRRRNSTGSSRFPKREAIEQLKVVMDYTLPEDRNKPSREERKLQAALAAIERKEEKEKRRAEAHKDSGDAKEKRGPGRPARSSTGSSGKVGKRHVEKHPEKEKDKKVEAVVEPSVRESPRGKKKREEFKENEVDEVSTIAQPPRKRWAAAVKENEAAQRASSPEVTSSSSATSMGAGDVSSADSVNPSSVGGKKLWLRRHAAESVSEESLQAVDTTASSEPLSCAADSTSDIATLPSRVQMSPPLKKRRHMLDACQSDEHVAATALAQMGAKAEGFRFHWNMALRYLMPNLNERLHVDFDLAETVHRPLPQPSVRQPPTTLPSVSVDTATTTSTSSQVPLASPVEVRKAKRLSLEDYKRRRSTMGPSDSAGGPTGAAAAQGTTGNDHKGRIGESSSRPSRSFIPTMDTSLDQSALLRPLDSSVPIPPLGVPPDLEVVKKMILEESCIPTPPVAPTLPPPPPPPPPPVETPASTVPASSSDMSIGSSSESGEERMSLADRLAKEFGVGTAGTPRSPKSLLSSSHRAVTLRDVPPPPPPGPRPTRNTRW